MIGSCECTWPSMAAMKLQQKGMRSLLPFIPRAMQSPMQLQPNRLAACARGGGGGRTCVNHVQLYEVCHECSARRLSLPPSLPPSSPQPYPHQCIEEGQTLVTAHCLTFTKPSIMGQGGGKGGLGDKEFGQSSPVMFQCWLVTILVNSDISPVLHIHTYALPLTPPYTTCSCH